MPLETARLRGTPCSATVVPKARPMIFDTYWSWLGKLSHAARFSCGRTHLADNARRKVRRACGWTIEQLDRRIVPTQLIPLSNHHDIIYNDADHILYVTTQMGTIERYNTDTQTSLTPWTINGALYGADITPDGHWMYVADKTQLSSTQAVIHKVNLLTGQVTDLTYPIHGGEGGSYDVTILPNGIALFSSDTDGPSGFVTMRQINLATDVITERTDLGGITEGTRFDVSPDRSRVYVKSAGPYGGGVQLYSTATNSIIGQFNAHTDTGLSMGSFSRDGSQYVFEFGEYPALINSAGDTLRVFQNLTAGVAFDPQRDILYIGDDTGDELRAYDTHTWSLLYSMSAGENLINSVQLEQGEIRFGNGKIFMETPQGVRIFTPPTPTANGVHLQIDGFDRRVAINFNSPITVSVRDANGNIVPNYTGTVHFTATGTSTLPADYTFTATDAGTHTFPIIYSTLGFQSLTVTDTVTANLTTRVGGISVEAFTAQPNVLPIIGTQDLLYEASRQVLYMPTVTGYIERYDVANQTMLPAWAIGGHPFQGDISLDGQYLYVTDDAKFGRDGLIHKIDLDTGEDVNLAFSMNSYEGGAFDLSIGEDGIALVTASFLGSGPVYLRHLDTATDTIIVVESSPGNGVEIPQNTYLTRGEDRSVLLLAAGFGTGFWPYYADTQTYGPGVSIGRYLDGAPMAISRDGNLIAVSHQSPIVVYDRNMQPVTTLAGQGTDGAVAFDPFRDIMYVVNSDLDEFRAYDTNTWALLFTQPFGEDIHVYGQMIVSSDGAHAFYTRQELVRMFDLPATPSLRIGNATVTEGQSAQKSIQLTVTLSVPVSSPVTVDYSTISGTATAGSDFVAATGTITFAPNQTTQTITVLINGDNAAEADETFQVVLSNSQNAVIADGKAIITILNNDSGILPSISGLDSQITVLETAVNSAPQLIDGNATFSDPDTPNLLGGNLNVAITSGGSADDQLAVRNQGTSAGQIGVVGTAVSFGGVSFATITNDGANGGMLVVSFTTSAATPAAIQALIENLTYGNTSDAPRQTRVISLVVTDNFDTPGPASTTTLTVTPQNDPPTLSTIANRTTTEDTSAPISFTVGDDETPLGSLIVTVTSSNHALLPDANAVLTGSTGTRTVTVTPLLNQSGTSTITVTVNDGTLQTVQTFLLTVTAVNDTPTISDQGNQSTNEDVALPSLPITIGDVDSPLANLTVTASSSNLALVPLSGIVITGSGATRAVQVTPSTNQSGVTTITLTVSDGNTSSSDSFVLTVIELPDAPTISDILDRTTNEDVPPPAQSFVIGDTDSPFNTLTVTAHSSNPAVVPDANILLTGSGASRTLNVTPLPNQFGTVIVTLTVSDGVLSSQDTFTLTILPIDDAPTIGQLSGRAIIEDTVAGPYPFTIDDIDTALNSLVVTASSSNPSLVPNENLLIAGTGANRTIKATPASNTNGVTTITISVSDGVSTATRSFQLSVLATIDPPQFGPIPNQIIDEDHSTAALVLSLTAGDTPLDGLSLSAASSNPGLLPEANIVFGHSGANRTLIATPLANQSGVATITISVNDGTSTVFQTFSVTVNAVNDPPTLASFPPQTINEDTSTSVLGFVIGDAESASSGLTVTATSSNPSLIPDSNILLSGTDANRTIKLTSVANGFGTANITVTVSDGTSTTSQVLQLTVLPINDSPSISDVANLTTDEDVATAVIPITVSDPDVAPGTLILTATSSDPLLVPSSNITLGGSGGSRTAVITPATNRSGTATITLTVSDGITTASDTFVLTVNTISDAPLITGLADLTINEDTSTPILSFSITDAESTSSTLTVTGISSNTGLVPSSNITFGGSDSTRFMTITPRANQFGSTIITVNVSDGVTTGTATFVLTVTNINDAPTLSAISTQTINEDNVLQALPFVIDDSDTAIGDLVITVSSSNPSLIPTANVVLNGTGTNRTLSISPLANLSGVSQITISANDGKVTSSSSFLVIVNSVNDAPRITLGSDQDLDEDAAPVSLPHWAINISAGPATETAQSLSILVSTDHPELFSIPPTINLDGDLTYKVAPNAHGQAVVTVDLIDDGGTSHGGIDTAASQTFHITIRSVADPFAFSTSNQVRQVVLGQLLTVDSQLTAHSVDHPNIDFSNGLLTVSISSGALKTDALSLPIVKKKLLPQAEISLVGTAVYVRNHQIGVLQGGVGTTPLQIKFGAGVTEAEVNTVLKSLNFKTKGKQPTPSTRTFHIVLQDATNAIHAETTRSAQIAKSR